jgi:hypothetical protein
MSEKAPDSKKGFTADWFMRGALTRIGDTIDRFMGRKWTPSSSIATSELIERMKRLLDSESKEIPGKGTVVPHNIKLKMQWDKFSTDADDALKSLETELLTAAVDHINDSLYYTTAPLTIKVAPDYFIEGVKLYVSFDGSEGEGNEAELNVTMPSIDLKQIPVPPPPAASTGATYVATFGIRGTNSQRKLVFAPGGRLSVGRTGGNGLVIDDPSVSKMHASLALTVEGELSVADTGSTNGTFINEQRIAYGKANRLMETDKVKFGEVEVKFERMTEPVNEPMAAENEPPPENEENRVSVDIGPPIVDKTLEIDREVKDETADGSSGEDSSAKVQ